MYRTQLKQKETPVIATDGMLNMKSPVSRNARPLRRQSLSGTQSPVMSSTTSVGVISNGFRKCPDELKSQGSITITYLLRCL